MSRSKRTHRCPPDHRHGEVSTCWARHGCGCDDCLDGQRDRMTRRRKQIAYGRHEPLRPITRARRHVNVLRAANWTVREIAVAAGVSVQIVNRVGLNHAKSITRESEERLLSVHPHRKNVAPLPASLVDATGTIRRIQALMALGWSGPQLMSRIGANPAYQTRLLNHPQVMERTRAAVAELYDELWDQHPPAQTAAERYVIRRVKRRAATNGWVPPLAWDDDTIDDPNAHPSDQVAAEKVNVLDELEALVSGGSAPHVAAETLGQKPTSLARLARRHDRPDLARLLERKAA